MHNVNVGLTRFKLGEEGGGGGGGARRASHHLWWPPLTPAAKPSAGNGLAGGSCTHATASGGFGTPMPMASQSECYPKTNGQGQVQLTTEVWPKCAGPSAQAESSWPAHSFII